MAETRLTNVVVPTVFDPYVAERALHLNKFFQAGVLVKSPVLFDNLAGGSNTFNIPFWQDLSGDAEIPTETSDMTVNPITADKMIARRQIRVKAWGANDLAAQLSGANPIQAIGDRVGGYWATQYQKYVTYSIRGIIADNVNDSSDLVVDISTETGLSATAANKISAIKTIEAVMKQGDRFNEIVAIAVHSVVYQTLVENDLIDYVQDSASSLSIPTYMGLKVIVDDDLPVIAGGVNGYKYHSYLFKAGAIAFAENPGKYVANETYRDPKGIGVDSLYTRRQFCIHPLGFSWVMSPDAAISPTDANLYAATSWNRVYNAKNAGVIALISNG